MTINEAEWRGNVVWYVQYFWHEVEWVQRHTKIDKVHKKDCIVQEFQLQFQFFRNCAELVRVVR